MTTKQIKITTLVIWSLLLFMLGYLSRCEKACVPIANTTIKTKVIEKTKIVDSLIKQTEAKKAELLPIKEKTKQLEKSVDIAKYKGDTLLIIQWQDTLIENQRLEIKTLESVVFLQGETIEGMQGIIELKDMQISSINYEVIEQQKQSKKMKRQRNLSILGGIVAVIGTILIIK